MKRFFLFCFLAIAATEAGYAQSDSTGLFLDLEAAQVLSTRSIVEQSSRQSTMNSEELKKHSFSDVPSLLSLLPSVVSVSENGSGYGGTSFYVRGTDATRINVTMNGMPMNNPDSHAMYWYDTPDLLSGTGSLQLIRGAGTSTNGTGAFGGGIAMSTSALSTESGGDVSLSYGSFNTVRQSLHVGSGLVGNHWITDLRLSHIDSDGYIDRGFTGMTSYMFQSGWFNDGTSLKFISFGGRTRTYLTYTGVTLDEMKEYGRKYHTSGQYSCSDGPFTLSDGTHVNYFDDQTDNYTQSNNQLVFTRNFSPSWTMNLTGYYVWGYGFYRQYKDDAYLCGYDNLVNDYSQADLIRRKLMKNHLYGLNATGIYSADGFKLVFGGSSLRYVCPHWGELDWVDGMEKTRYEDFVWYRNDVGKIDANLFAKADWKPFGSLELYSDLQWRIVSYESDGENDNYDWNKCRMQEVAIDKLWNFFNPGVGAKYAFSRKHSIETSFSMAHKEPARADFTDRYLFSSISDQPRPETLFDWELAYRYSGRIVNAGVNFYDMVYRNQLVPTGIVNDSSDNLNVNIPDSFRRGVELDFGAILCKWFSINASATLSKNVIKDFTEVIDGKEFYVGDTEIAYSPSSIAKASANFRTGGLEASLIWSYVGKQFFTNGMHDDLALDAWSTADLNLSWSVKSVLLGFKLGNILNREYCPYAYGGSWMEDGERKSWAYYFPQPGINAIASVTVYF